MKLEAKNLRKEHSPGVGLINGSIQIESGSVAALVGPNGSGKSTFVKLLAGTYLTCPKRKTGE